MSVSNVCPRQEYLGQKQLYSVVLDKDSSILKQIQWYIVYMVALGLEMWYFGKYKYYGKYSGASTVVFWG